MKELFKPKVKEDKTAKDKIIIILSVICCVAYALVLVAIILIVTKAPVPVGFTAIILLTGSFAGPVCTGLMLSRTIKLIKEAKKPHRGQLATDFNVSQNAEKHETAAPSDDPQNS